MKVTKFILLIIFAYVSCQIYAYSLGGNPDSPYTVFNRSKGGVVLTSYKFGTINNPVRGTQVFNNDRFKIDMGCYVSIKDTKSGEIYKYDSESNNISPLQIINSQRYNSYNRFSSFLKSVAKELGFEVSPVRTSQCIIHKGSHVENESIDSLSIAISLRIKNAIQDSIFFNNVIVDYNYYNDKSFNYIIQNNDSIGYAFVVYTVGKTGDTSKHNKILVQNNLGEFKPDNIEFLLLPPNYRLILDYFLLESPTDDDNRTLYILLFNPADFYEGQIGINEEEKFNSIVNWRIIESELKYRGNVNIPIFLKR